MADTNSTTFWIVLIVGVAVGLLAYAARWYRSSGRRLLGQWWECRTQRCDYYRHFLAYGPADMPHATWHFVSAQGLEHFRTCRWQPPKDSWLHDDRLRHCPTCLSYERRLRA